MTAKEAPDKEKCHIGTFCGHLDGSAYNISIKDAVMDIDSKPTSGYMDYYSKYTTIGFCGPTAKIDNDFILDLGNDNPAPYTGDTGYFWMDYYFDNVGKTVFYYDSFGRRQSVNNFLMGGNAYPANSPQNSNLLQRTNPLSATPGNIQFRQSQGVKALGIFELHTKNNGSPTIDALTFTNPTVQKSTVYYYNASNASGSANHIITGTAQTIDIDLNRNYLTNPHLTNAINDPKRTELQSELFNPYYYMGYRPSEMYIKSFSYKWTVQNSNNAGTVTLQDQYTGNGNIGSTNIPSCLYFKIPKPAPDFEEPYKTVTIYVVAQATSSTSNGNNVIDLVKQQGNGLVAAGLNGVANSVTIPRDSNLYMIEYNIPVDRMTTTEYNSANEADKVVEYGFALAANGNITGVNFVYFSVGGQPKGQNEHINVDSHAALPSIDYIYDVTVPVSAPGYCYTKILPYFIHGSTGSEFKTVDELKLTFTRNVVTSETDASIHFHIRAERMAAQESSLGSLGGAPVLYYHR